MIQKMGGDVLVETQNEIGNKYTLKFTTVSRIGEDKRDLFNEDWRDRFKILLQEAEDERMVQGHNLPDSIVRNNSSDSLFFSQQYDLQKLMQM